MKTPRWMIAAGAGAAVLAWGSSAQAQAFAIDWFTVDGGGGTSAGGVFSLSGTIGQPDAGPPMSGISGGGVTFTMTGGFWAGATAPPPACAADFNMDGNLDPDDLSDFITCFFTEVQFPGACPTADFNADSNVDPDDLSDYITAFFTGC